MATWPYLLFGFAAGWMIPVQFGINAQLARWLGSPLRAALISFVIGTLALFVVMAVAERDWPSVSQMTSSPWWVWLGGFLGAFYVFGSIVTAPKLGAATLIVVVLAGQTVAALLVDHFGWLGFAENPITPGRLVGMALVAAGVALVRFA